MVGLNLINDMTKDDIQKLIDSFDYVFLDIDGVLAQGRSLIPGAADAVGKLRQLGKHIVFVTNNSLYTIDMLYERLKAFGVRKGEVVTPNHALLNYLKKIAFKKDIYVVGSTYSKKLLKEAGYNVIEYKDIQPTDLEEMLDVINKLSIKALEKCRNVGAVYVDYDINVHIGQIQVAEEVLNNIKDVLFLSGMNDDTGKVSATATIIGPLFYINALERWSNMKSISMGKPGDSLREVLNSKYQISDFSRVLFVGDNVNTDITFAKSCGYQTLLVLSGVTSKNQVDQWEFPESSKPAYIASSLAELYEHIIKDL